MGIIIGKLFMGTESDYGDVGVCIKQENGIDLLSQVVTYEIRQQYTEKYNSEWDKTDDEEYECGEMLHIQIPNVQMSFHASDEPITHEQAQEKLALLSMGLLDINICWYGYSEYTILGYETSKFMLGNHDLEKIFESYDGKHVVIEIDVKDAA